MISIEIKYFSEEQPCTPFVPPKETKTFLRAESRTTLRETKKIQIKFATTCKKNEQQKSVKNNAEL